MNRRSSRPIRAGSNYDYDRAKNGHSEEKKCVAPRMARKFLAGQRLTFSGVKKSDKNRPRTAILSNAVGAEQSLLP
jgi:hypothetical protein